MAKTVILHLSGENPAMGEIEDEPDPRDMFIKVFNLKQLDGKEVHYLSHGVEAVIFPWHRITFLEIMAGQADTGEIIGFFR